MSKKFFRPPTNSYVDSEDEEEDDSEEEEQGGRTMNNTGGRNTSTSKNTANLSSDDDDDDDDDDEEEEEETPAKAKPNTSKRKAGGGGSEKQRKRPKASSFFELEAEASDEEEEEEHERRGRGGGRAGGDDGEGMDREALELIKLQDRRRAQAGGAMLERTAAEMARDIEQRHRMQNRRPMNHGRIRPDARHVPPARTSGGKSATATGNAAARGNLSAASATLAASTAPNAPPPPVPMEMHRDVVDDEGGPEAYTAVAQQSLVPSVNDPSFWMISCATGKEQDMVLQLMNKAVAFARQNRPLGITGAIAAQSKGKIYVEAFSEPAVMEAIQNVRGLLQYSMRLVPIGDMTTVMTVTSKKKPVQKNEWVRLTRGHYKGDLALVKEVKDSGLRCIVQCVPRLDLTLGDLSAEEARMRRRTVRPPQKFFSPQELKAMGKHNILRQLFPGLNAYCYVFEGNFYEDGYLLKEMTVGSMVKPCTDEDPPTLDELQRFQRRKAGGGDNDEGAENEGSKIAASLLDELAELQNKTGFDKQAQKVGGLLIGDTIEVVEGDLIGVQGKIVSLDGSTVKVQPTSADASLTGEIEFLMSQVRKHIPEGTHVKVMDGRYANETGVVVAVDKMEGGGSSSNDFTAIVLTDVTNKQITVRLAQLRETAEVASGQDKLNSFELYDLVVLSGGGSVNEVGVIVRVGREDFTVVNNHGIAREVRPEELLGKKNTMSNKAVALDVQGNQIRCGDTVNVVEGRHKGKAATIKRMNRSQLFLHSQTRLEHAGIFVVKSRSCVLAGSRTQNRAGGADGGQSPWTPQSNQNSRGPARKRDDGLIGKTVRIQAGSWKGFIGTVCDVTGTHVQVELHARLKKVTVTHERVHVVGDKFGATENQSSSNAPVNPTVMAPTTPFVAAGQTPMHGGATPKHPSGGLDADGGGDEVWRPGGSIDQDNVDTSKENDGWGATNNDQDGDDDDDWGSSSNNQAEGEWGAPPPPPTQEQPVVKEPKDFDTNGASSSKGNATVKEESSSSSTNNHNSGVSVKREQQTASEVEHDLPDNEERPGWLMERVCINLKGPSEKKGSVKEIHPSKIVVELEDGSTENVAVHDISMVVPAEHDPVLVTGGNEVGLEGTLVCIDGTDAILKDANDAFKIVEFSFLAKVKA